MLLSAPACDVPGSLVTCHCPAQLVPTHIKPAANTVQPTVQHRGAAATGCAPAHMRYPRRTSLAGPHPLQHLSQDRACASSIPSHLIPFSGEFFRSYAPPGSNATPKRSTWHRRRARMRLRIIMAAPEPPGAAPAARSMRSTSRRNTLDKAHTYNGGRLLRDAAPQLPRACYAGANTAGRTHA